MTVDIPALPEDLYATRDEAPDAEPQPVPQAARSVSPFRFAQKHDKNERPRAYASPYPSHLPDADLPLFTPEPPAPIVTAAQLLDTVRVYLSPSDVENVRRAYRYADNAHLGQFRKSGEPYITHPLAVAGILASWRMDAQAIAAGLMHDVLEDTQTSKIEMTNLFGSEVANIVDGVSKLDKLRFSSNEIAQAESFRKMLLAMSRDVRVILVKLADRLHNMRTLGVMRPEKRARIARETLDIYVPLAHRLGLNNVFRELQELSFANRYPFRYKVLYENVLKLRNERRPVLERIMNETREQFARDGIRMRILGRDKTIYGIYSKMREKHQSFSDALDIYGFRLIVRTLDDCYLALGCLHRLYKPVHARFKDFIAIPKMNGYQSLHTTVIGPDGTPVEYQIRTEEMHRVDEDGILVHWLYRDQDASGLQSRTTAWLQNLLEIQRTSTDSTEFLENIKVDLFPNRVYVFTPQGKIISLPRGSSPIDFAYEIHTDVGNHAKAARVNGEPKPLTCELRNGDKVEIVTSSDASPSPAWLEHVHSGRARAEIRQYLRNCQFDESVRLGRLALENLAESEGVDLAALDDDVRKLVLKEFGSESLASLYASIGLGKCLPAAVLHRILTIRNQVLAEKGEHRAQAENLPAVVIKGSEGTGLHLAPCCHPIPGDRIRGFSRPGQGLTVHRADCTHAKRGAKADPSRWMDVQWSDVPQTEPRFAVPLEILVDDAHAGLAAVATSVAKANSSIVGLALDDADGTCIVRPIVQVRDRDHLVHVMRTIRQNEVVRKVKRILDDRKAGKEPRAAKSAKSDKTGKARPHDEDASS